MKDDPILVGRADSDGIGALFARTVSDLESFVKAEIELQKARVVAKVDGARSALLMLVGAIVLGGVAMTGLVVGVLMILTPRVGPIAATAIVVGTLLVGSGVLGWLALNRFKLVFGAIEETP